MIALVNSKDSAFDAYQSILDLFNKHKYVRVKIEQESRTLRQNGWINKSYQMLAAQGDMTQSEYRRYCKFHFGLNILFEENPESAVIWRKMLKSVSYEDKLLSMDQIDVTSTFNVDQGKRYIEEIINAFSDKQLPEKVK